MELACRMFVETFHFQFYVWFREITGERKENVKGHKFSMENIE